MTSIVIDTLGGLITSSSGLTGPSVLWIHGYTMDTSLWRRIWNELPHYAHVGVDLPGHGLTPVPTELQRIDQVARNLGEECQKHNLRHVVGLSFGSALVVQLCLEFPELFKTVTLAAPTVLGIDEGNEIRQVYIELNRIYASMGPGPWMGDYWTSHAHVLFREASRRKSLWIDLQRVIRAHRWAEFQTGFMRQLVEFDQISRLASLRTLRASMLIMTGERDILASRSAARTLGHTVNQVCCKVIPDSGHLCLLERPKLSALSLHEHIRSGECRL